MESDEIIDRESWENNYCLFISILSVLAMPPLEQCNSMGNYNTAWELRTDGMDVDYLLNQCVIEFTIEQKDLMRHLSLSLHALDTKLFINGDILENNLKDMEIETWQIVREIAKNLLTSLESKTFENRKYLNLDY